MDHLFLILGRFGSSLLPQFQAVPRRVWMIDLAREQAPTRDHLYRYAATALDAGADGLGLYLEHRFAYPSAKWAHGKGCVTPAMVRDLESEFPSLEIIPFINLLGHVEGFLYCEEGREMRADLFSGLQASASSPEFNKLADGLLEDTLAAFKAEHIHIGGDETAQLTSHPRDKDRNPAEVYGEWFGPLAERVIEAGRTPMIWGDMLLEHPEAAAAIPKQTHVIDWQYYTGCQETCEKLKVLGFEHVWGSPTLHIYNSEWMHLKESEENVRAVSKDAHDLNLEGICLTTWEFGMMAAADTFLPAVRASLRMMGDPESEGDTASDFGKAEPWARMMGEDLPQAGDPFAFSRIRSGVKCRLLLYGNPFLLWMRHREELCGPTGDKALEIAEQAIQAAPTEAEKGPAFFVRGAVEFCRLVEEAQQFYAKEQPEESLQRLSACRHVFDTLESVAQKTHERTGGSMADVERAIAGKRAVEEAIRRVQKYGRRELGYLPAFEVLTHPSFQPHDQACWWLINKWARE